MSTPSSPVSETRSPQWRDGRRNGIKWAIEYLHKRALEMNDPNAKAILNTAAFNMGVTAKGHCGCPACQTSRHTSSCAVHNAPALPIGECDCGARPMSAMTLRNAVACWDMAEG